METIQIDIWFWLALMITLGSFTLGYYIHMFLNDERVEEED
ncbi:hypothetical protein [Persicobacter diffluens]|uniref:Uncharacterized protein n=1 Tax=Persicobacter diffluens TaxID=981 RepID=A0AAN5AKZ0_9BACT|nr:hypothetical protein PEDI_32460 [Persicobacter diffluens]